MRALLEQRDEQTRGERVSRSCAVHRVDRRRCRAGQLLAVVQENGALCAERQRDEAVAPRRASRARGGSRRRGPRRRRSGRAGAALRQKRPVHSSHAARTASSGISSWQRTASCGGRSTAPRVAFAPGATAIVVSPAASTWMSATPVGASVSSSTNPHACRAKARERLLGLRVAPDRRDHRHLGPEPRARDGLVRTLSPRQATERPAADGLARLGQPLDPHDEVEVHGTDDDDPRRHGSRTSGG